MDDAIKKSILQMAHGAFMERADYEMSRIMENILDVNTPAKDKRKLTITMEFKPDETRQNIAVNTTAKSTLAPTKPVTTFLFAADGENIVEMAPQIPGQMGLDGGTQEAPPSLKIIKFA